MQTDAKANDFQLPDAKSVESVIEDYETIERNYVELPKNIADKKETVSKFLSAAYNHYNRFTGQSSRTELLRYLKDADAKFRMARGQAQQFRDDSSQKQNTLSHVASSQFYRSCKLIWTGLCNIIFGQDNELPAKYERIFDSCDYTPTEGERVAKEQTMYFKWVYDRENWEQWIKNSLYWVVKNAHELISVQWEYKTDTRIERVPGYYTKDKKPIEIIQVNGEAVAKETGKVYDGRGYDANGDAVAELFSEDGRPKSYVFMEKTRVIKNNPVLLRYRMEDSYFDLDIAEDGTDPDLDTIQKQTCLLFNNQEPLSTAMTKERDGLYMNVKDLKEEHLYEYSTATTNDLKSEKDNNADFTADNYKNGLFDKWHIWMKAPINGKGEWEDGIVPEWHEAVFYGKVNEMPSESGEDNKCGAVCVMLRKNPYHHKRLPYKLVFSHLDDKGAVRMGYYSLLECNIEEQTVTMNQHIDNKTLKIKTPFIGERGNVLDRDLKFKSGNQVIWVRAGTAQTALTQLKIDDMTQTTIPTIEMLRKDADETVGTTDVIQGQYAGSRTTGTEVVSVREQALQPAIEHAKFMGVQVLGYILRDVQDNCRQFADPDQDIILYDDRGNNMGTVRPSELYGDLKTKISCIDHFRADITARQALTNFIGAGGYQMASPFMGKSGALQFWRTYGKFLKMPDVTKIFPEMKKNMEAENQAWADIAIILSDPMRAMTDEALLPKEGEQHEVHLPILRNERDRLAIVVNTLDEIQKEQVLLSLQALDLYILMHEQFSQADDAEAQMMQPQEQGQAGQPMEPTMEGEASGDALAGLQGQQATGGM